MNFPVHLAMCLDRQISTLEKLPFKLCNSYACFLTYFDVGGSILKVRLSCGDRSPVESTKARYFCAREKREKPRMPSVPLLHDLWMLLCSFPSSAKTSRPQSCEGRVPKKQHNQIKQQVRHGSPVKFNKSTTSKVSLQNGLATRLELQPKNLWQPNSTYKTV